MDALFGLFIFMWGYRLSYFFSHAAVRYRSFVDTRPKTTGTHAVMWIQEGAVLTCLELDCRTTQKL